MTPEAGRWYIDARPGHEGIPGQERFRVIEVGAETLKVEDEYGIQRVVNAIAFQAQMTPVTP